MDKLMQELKPQVVLTTRERKLEGFYENFNISDDRYFDLLNNLMTDEKLSISVRSMFLIVLDNDIICADIMKRSIRQAFDRAAHVLIDNDEIFWEY